jgi:tetratricopeptide (TPR) repeat protein
MKGQNDLAIADQTQALRIYPNSAYAYNGRGNAYESEGKYDLAMADYNQAIQVDPTFYYAYYDRGNAYQGNGQNDLAIADYTQTLRINPSYASAYGGRAVSYYANGESDLAIADFTQALRIDPNDVKAYLGRGAILLSQNNFSAAGKDFSSALSLDHTNAYAVIFLHVSKARAGVSDASEFSTNVASLDIGTWPGPLLTFYLGRLTATQAIATAPDRDDHCDALFFVAEWQLTQQKADAARSGFQQVLDSCAHDVTIHTLARGELRQLGP